MNNDALRSDRSEHLKLQPPCEEAGVPPPQLDHIPEPPVPEYRIYRVTRAPSDDHGSRILQPAYAERLTEEEEARIHASRRSIKGRGYRFEKAGVSHEIPLTEGQAIDLRRNDWLLGRDRVPRSKRELAVVEYLSRRHREIEARRRPLARAQLKREAEREEEGKRATVESLYMPRALRKVPRAFRPLAWHALEDEYEHRRCDYEGRPFGENYVSVKRKADWDELDLLEIRRIVFGWKVHPPLDRFFSLDDQFDPAGREHVERALRDLPDSPIAIAAMLTEFKPIAAKMEPFEALLQDESLGWMATGEEEAAVARLNQRGAKLREEIRDAEESLRRMGWQVGPDGLLKSRPGSEGGRAGAYLNRVIANLYLYLKPIYEGAFKNLEDNPEELREQVGRLLEPYFDPADLDPGRKGRIGNQFNNTIHRSRRATSRPEFEVA